MKTLTVRVPAELHDQSNEVLEEIGLDVTTACRLFLTQVAMTRSIPFPLKATDARWEIMQVDKELQNEMDQIADAWSRKHGGK